MTIRCSRCILPETYPNTTFNEEGACNHCTTYRPFVPFPEKLLIQRFHAVRKRCHPYDALVPLSGGKDSTYVLYLATKVYGLRVLAYTFNNGFLTDLARRNIEQALAASRADHYLYRPNLELLRRLYRNHLYQAGEFCSVCAFGINAGYIRAASAFSIPLVLVGNSLIEEASGTTDNAFDHERFLSISTEDGNVSDSEAKRFLPLRHMGLIGRRLYSRISGVAQVISPFYYRPRIAEADMAAIVAREMGWDAGGGSDHGKHIDCIAESLSNELRLRRFGYMRKTVQYSTLIRLGELSREDALRRLESPASTEAHAATQQTLQLLDVPESDIPKICSAPVSPAATRRTLETRILRGIYNASMRHPKLRALVRSVWRRI